MLEARGPRFSPFVAVVAALVGLAFESHAATLPEPRSIGELIFAEDFESGDLLGWSSSTGGPPEGALPPDPAEIAPPLDPTLPLDVFESSRFLWESDPPIQVDVAPGAIFPDRICLVRGRVLRRDGQPLRGVKVTVHGQADVGSTRTRSDGYYDLALRGGAEVTVTYEKRGFLPIARRVEALRQDWAWAEDAVMIPLDPAVWPISSGATEMQVARGSVQVDADGPRQATLMFRAETSAEMWVPGVGAVPLPLFHVRATEYTVGEQGPAAMPAPLPAQVGYTYAVELSADEALAANAVAVTFSRPVVTYVENFLDFPVGDPVPAAWYERELAAWVPSPDGRIVAILSETDGLADLDVDGSGLPADEPTLLDLGIEPAERQRLAVLYEPGQSLWRVEVTHFTPWDFNWPAGPPPDADPPPDPAGQGDPPPDDPVDPGGVPDPDAGAPITGNPDCEPGSILECENQVLRESLALTGVPHRLHYASDRVRGRSDPLRFSIRVTGATIPASLLHVGLVVEAAGEIYRWGTPIPVPNQRHTVTWNFVDRYQRPIHAEEPATIRLTYTYPLVYYTARGPWEASFSRLPTEGVSFPSLRSGSRFTITRTVRTTVGALAHHLVGPWDVSGEGLGGWTFDLHHRYHPRTGTLLPGHGGRQVAHARPLVAPRLLGTGIAGTSGDGGPGRLARLEAPAGLALGPDGSLYVSDATARTVRRLRPDGIVERFAGTGETCDPGGGARSEGGGGCGDGGPAIAGKLLAPGGLAVTPEGSLLIADGLFVRRVDPQGILSTVAGSWDDIPPPQLGEGSCDGDCPATEVSLLGVADVAALADGAFFLVESNRNRLSFVATNGRWSRVAGGDASGSAGDGGPAYFAELSSPTGLALGPAGELFVADSGNHRLRRIGTDGIITTVAGTGVPGFSGDGGPATAAKLWFPTRVAAASDGAVYLVDQFNQRVREVTAGGKIETVVGLDAAPTFVDGDHALQTPLDWPTAVAVEPRGRLFVADAGGHHVLEVTDVRPRPSSGEILIPSGDGTEVYVFSPAGRHLRTVHALTGATLLSFEYTGSGRLHRVVDAHGNATEVVRDGAGAPQAIVGPYGQVTTLELDSFGYLASVTNPAGETTELASTTTGLLLSRREPRGNTKHFSWDTTGRLKGELDADGGSKLLSRFGVGDRTYAHFRVSFTSAEGRHTLHDTWYSWSGRRKWKTQILGPGENLVTRTTAHRDGWSLRERPDGSQTLSSARPDPVWGLGVERFGAGSLSIPGGLSRSFASFAEAVLGDPLDPLSVSARVETYQVNGRVSTRTYDAALRRWLATSAAGRVSRLDLDTLGRPAESAVGTLEPTRYEYDARGRLESISSGVGAEERLVTFGYDPLGRLVSITDPLEREVAFEYDAANRVSRQLLPGGREILFDWDENGNLTGLTPPARPVHEFDHGPVDLVSEYAPPSLGSGEWSTLYGHNLDRQPTLVERPDAATIALAYDAGQRLSALTTPRGTTEVVYDPQSGHVASLTTPEGNGLSFTMDGPLVTATAWTGEVAGSVERTYDADLRLATISVNGADPIAYDYDDDGLLVQAGAMTLSRDAATGLLTGTALGVVTTSYGHNGFGELATMTAAVSGTPIWEVAYTRDQLGRITEKVETIQGATDTYVYRYDLAGRLEEVEVNGLVTATYTFDANGNRLTKTTPGGTEAGTYDAQDRLLAYDGTTFTYTRNGELASATDAGGTTGFTYDVFGNLLEVNPPSDPEIEYVVDARNRRIGKKLDGTLVQGLLWQSQLAPIAELDGAGAIVSRFVHATRVNVPDYLIRDGSTYRILADHLGSPRLVIDTATGAVVQRLDFDEWGVVLADTNPGWTPFGFAGGLYEAASGLVRFGARDFEAGSGRWTSKDPIGFVAGETDLLGYAANDPVNRADPNGLFAGRLLCRLMGPLSGGASTQELELAGMIADGLIAAGLAASDYDQQSLRSQLPTGVNVVLDAQQVQGGWSLIAVGKGLATGVGAGAGSATFGVLVAGGGGWLIGTGLDNLYQDLGGTPLSDYLYDWFLDDGFRLSPNDLPPPYGAGGCSGDPTCP